MKRIDKSNPIPLVHQLTQILREDIMKEVYPTHSLFPTEAELTKKYEVSRTTVRMALKKLVKENLIYRKQGRGTFVNSVNSISNSKSPQHVAKDVLELKSTTNIIESAGMESSSHILQFELKKPNTKVATNLNISYQSEVWVIKR